MEGETCAVQQVQELVYDDLNRVVTAIANAVPGAPASNDTNVTTQFAYDRVGNLLSLTDANGTLTSFTYDVLDRLVRQETAAAQVTTYGYDALGNLVKLTNPRGFSTSFSYDAANRLASVSDALQQTTSFGYDANGNLVSQTDPNGIVTAYRYNALDRLEALVQNERPGESASSTQNVTTRFEYDLAGNLRFVFDPRGSYVTEHAYDADLRRVRTRDAEGGVTSFDYDRVNNLVAVTDANGHTTTSTYNGRNRLVRLTNPEGHAVSFGYDQLDNLIRLTDARGFTSTYVYDGLDRVISFTDNLGGIWRYQYDAVGNLLAETDANGHSNSFAYDLVYRLLSRTDAEGYVTSWTYDANNNPLTRTDGNGHTSRSSYDALDRVATRTNAENETSAYAYDWMGNLLALTEADGIVTGYGYDPLYRLSSVTFNQRPGVPASVEVNVTTRYSYDEVGNLILIRDANGNPTSFSFDGLNRLTREVDALGNSWRYGYDKTFNRIERIDALRNRTTYRYYADDQLQRVDYHDGTFVAYTFDENNNALTVANELGTIVRSYDGLNRLLEETDVHGRATAFGYDAVGNRVSLTYPDQRTVRSSYLKNNWLASTTDPEGRSTRYFRDGVGQVVRQENPNSTVTIQRFDKANRLLSVENRQIGGANTINSRFVYTYDKVGQRVTMEATYAWRNPRVVTSTYSYDPLRRMVRDEDSQGIWTAYSFDAVGNRLTLTTNDSSTTNRPFDRKTLHYSYNAINQLLSVVGDTHPGSAGLKRHENSAQALHAFRHAVAAQRGKGISEAAANDLLARADALLAQLYGRPTPNVAAVDSALNSLRSQVEQYQSEGALRNQGIATSLLAKLRLAGDANNGASGELQTVTYSYDANGNRINKEFPGPQGPRIQGSDYRYDPENRLVVVQDYQQNLQGNRVDRAVTTMAHDGNGRRVVKSYDPKVAGGGNKRVEYVYDGLDPIAEYNTWNPQYDNYYRGDRGRILQKHHFPNGTQGQVFWYHYDGLGSVAGLTKHQGQSSHNYRYEPYGQIELPKGNFTDPHNHYTFTGQEWNEHTGLYEFYARHYDADTGTWMSQDPYRGQISDPRSLHRYQYVYNSPVNYWDVYGYVPVAAIAGIIVVGVVVGAVANVGARYVGDVIENIQEGKESWDVLKPKSSKEEYTSPFASV
ncbi:MAG: RHS repeat-associated core domain-containing protein [Oscillochloridaceae bacterium umkhey_bin13]